MLHQFLDFLGHLDVYLTAWTQAYGPWVYAILFAIVFSETGLVFAPFLPGDSLLFAVGALAALPDSGLNLLGAAIVFILAAFIGDNTNYQVGKYFGAKVFANPNGRFLNPVNLERTRAFYIRYGPKTVVLARFIPLLRTFAPFVAGMGKMKMMTYWGYSFLGSILWILTFMTAGFLFGRQPQIKSHFQLVILAIILISLIPGIVTFIREKNVGILGP